MRKIINFHPFACAGRHPVSYAADKWQTSVALFGSIFASFEFVCRPDRARSGFVFGNKKIISGVNFSEVQLAHSMVVFM